MLVECQRCGAPLEVGAADRFKKCHYCDAVNKTKSAKTIAMETPANWAPPPTWRPPASARAQPKVFVYHATQVTTADQAKAQSGCIALIIVPAMLLPFGIGMCAMVQDSSCAIGGPDAATAPRYGVFNEATLVEGRAISGSVEPSTSTSTYASGAGCNGSIEDAPTIVLDLSVMTLVNLETASLEDTVLVVREQGGTFHCDDDTGGNRNARLGIPLPAGRHALWVGSFETSAATAFELRLRGVPISSRPNAVGLVTEGPGSLGVIDLAAQPAGRVQGNLAPMVDASSVGSGCRGSVNAVADLALIATSQESITIDATSAIDTVLVVRTPDGQYHCNDDSNGVNPRVNIVTQPGTTHVWVGPLSPSSPGTFELSYAASDLGSEPVDPFGFALSAEPTLRPTPVTDADLARPLRLEGSVDAVVDVSAVGSGCRGFVPRAPGLRVELARPHELELRTASSTDLILAVRGPDGIFHCDDDSGGGGQPRFRAVFGPGQHLVWVGRFSDGEPVSFHLIVLER